MTMLNIPLMQNNIIKEDLDVLCDFIQNTDRFTNGPKVREFEKVWSEWLGVKYSVFVNSGASANLITLQACKILYGPLDVIVPPLTWSSDISSVYHLGLNPIFIDINLSTLAMDEDKVISALKGERKIIFLSHILGLCGLSDKLLNAIEDNNAILIEDVCESHGTTYKGKKLGSFGKASNFSFYYAHHMSTIEGGVICTDDKKFYEICRMLRSHGMLRESDSDELKEEYLKKYPDLHPEFIFTHLGWNMRSTELNAVLGINQLKRLDENNHKRRENFELFIKNLNPNLYFNEYLIEGNCNYALTLLLRNDDSELFSRVCELLNSENVEFRRGMAGGGNMLRQPFIKERVGNVAEEYINTERVHHYGLYIGNYPDLEHSKILELCKKLNMINVVR